MAKYDITSEMLIQIVNAYYKNDFDPMLNSMHPDVTFLFTGRNQFVEGRDQLEVIIKQNTKAIKDKAVSYEFLEMSCKAYPIKQNSCYTVMQMEIRAHLSDGTASQVNQRIVVYWQEYKRLQYAKDDYREGWFVISVHVSVAADSLLEVINQHKTPEGILHGVLNTIEKEPIIEDPYEVMDQWKKHRFISKKQIKRIQGNGAYSNIILADRTELKIHKKLDEFEQELSADGFVRIHKSHLINALYVKTVTAYKLGMTEGTVLPIAKVRYREVKNQLRK